jgi:ATP-dependent RNA helicase SUPV3L1/SUV3
MAFTPILKAVLGPTNTGKTHYAVERMLGRSSGVIGLPLRLLAREVYDRIVARIGANQVALVTGEEKIVPKGARYYVCTVEAMPVDRRFAFLAVDEVQLMANHERGHVFTDRVFNARGYEETLFLGAETARDVLRTLIPGIEFDRRERFSELTYAGHTKLNRLPKRSVIVAFSAKDVYAIAEAMRRLRGGAAVVMGGLSPRTRNAQAELFQSGDVDFLVATDAVGMGLNLDTDHVAFASLSKYDGRRRRYLTPMEAGQIAGRAGRFRNNGTFGTTGDCAPMEDGLVDRIVRHAFESLHYVEWRNSALDFTSLDALVESLHAPRPTKRLRRIKGAVDELSLERMMAIPEVASGIHLPVQVRQLWEVCCIPDFRNLTIDAHVRLVQDIYRTLVSRGGKLSDDFMAMKIGRCDDVSGDVDTLSARLARIRTWTYCAAKTNWMTDPVHWAQEARMVEDRLSDALHEGLIARFVDKRTSKLLKSIGSGDTMEASIKDDGAVYVDDHLIGHLRGLSFERDAIGSDLEAKALEAAAAKAVAPEVDRRLTSLSSGQAAIFTLSDRGEILWGGMAVGRIAKSGTIFTPDVEVMGGELGNPVLRQLAEDRMRSWLRAEVDAHLGALKKLKTLQDDPSVLPGSKGFAFTLLEHNGSVERWRVAQTVRKLDQNERRDLRSASVVFGQFDIFISELLKPKPARLLSLLHAYGAGGDGKPFIPFAGVTSIPNEGDLHSDNFSTEALALAGYKAVGSRIIRFDILNRLGSLIRDAHGQFEKSALEKPKKRTFQIMNEMLALLGANLEQTRGVLRALGYTSFTSETALVAAPVEEAAPEDGSDTTVEEAKSETPSPVEAVAVETSAPETADTAETPDTAAPTTDMVPDSKTSQEAETSAPISAKTPPAHLPKRQRAKWRPPMSVHEERETLEDGTTRALPNLEYWVQGDRQRRGGGKGRGQQPHRQRRSGFVNDSSGGHQGGYRKNKPRRDKNRGPKVGGYSAGKAPRPRKSLENSPFAALAALKASPPDGPKDSAKDSPQKKPEKSPDAAPDNNPATETTTDAMKPDDKS